MKCRRCGRVNPKPTCFVCVAQDECDRRNRKRGIRVEPRPDLPLDGFTLQPEEIPQPESTRLVIAFAPDDYSKQQAEISAPLMQSYAAKCGADFRLVTDNHFPDWPMANKYRVNTWAKQYETTLYLDVDVIIQNDPPSIFDVVPFNHFAVHDECPHFPPQWNESASRRLMRSQALPEWTAKHHANGGVMLIPADHVYAYRPPPRSTAKHWVADQLWLSYLLEKFDVPTHWLDGRWNCEWISQTFWGLVETAYFVHLNGTKPLPYRLKLMQQIASGDYSVLDQGYDRERLSIPATV